MGGRPAARWGEKLAIATGLALIASALVFFLSLLVAIIVLLFIGFFRHVDMALAYRVIAAPLAAATLPVALIVAFWWQGRTRRSPRT